MNMTSAVNSPAPFADEKRNLSSRRPAHVGVKEEYPLNSGYFTAIGSCSVKMVADRYRHAAHHNKHWRRAFQIY